MSTDLIRSFLRFGLVGVAATATHYLVLIAFVELLDVWHVLANGLAFLVACGVTFLGQSLWAFPDATELETNHRLARFATATLFGFGANMGLMALMTEVAGLPYRQGFLICLFVIPLLGFVLGRFWVFAKHDT